MIAPEQFSALVSRLERSIQDGDVTSRADVEAECLGVIDRYGEEPQGSAFFALGAVVALYYVASGQTGHARTRMIDLVDAADDDGVGDLLALTESWLRDPSTNSEAMLSASIASDARHRVSEPG